MELIESSELKRAKEALKRSEMRLKNIFAASPDAITVSDLNGKITDCNQATLDLHGYSLKEELIGKSAFEFIAKKDHKRAMENLKKTLEQGSVKNIEYTFLTKDGHEFPAELSANVIKDYSGKPTGFVAITKDITERKQMEEALRESEEKYRKQFEEAMDAIFVADAETGILIDCNRAASELVGRKKSELVGKHQRILHPPQEIEGEFSRTFKQHLQEKEGHVLETRVITKKGEIKDVAIKANLFEFRGKKMLQGIFRDITERKKAEKALKESEKKYRELVDLLPQIVFEFDERGNFTFANRKGFESFGYTPEDVEKGVNVLQMFIPEDRERAKKNVQRKLSGERFCGTEYTALRKDGSTFPVMIYSSPIIRENKPVGLRGIVVDITERKKAEERIRESEEKLRQYSEHLEELVQKRTEEFLESEKRYSVLVEEASDGVVIAQDGKIVFANKKALEICGYSRDELIGLPFEKLVDEKYLQLLKERHERRLQGEKVPVTYEAEGIAKTGERLPVEVSATRIDYQGRPASLVIVRDIRERKQMEEERLKLEKLATIGELATMVGHDLRNPLQSIENAVYHLNNELTRLSPSIPQKTMEMLQVINNSIGYANKIIRDLQDFSATKKPILKKININAVVKEALSQVEAPENVELFTELGRLPEIMADKDMIKRVFLNSAVNGIQAMENGGRLKVSTKKTKGFIEVSFKDTGVGIPKESMEKLFTPFFTTKAKGIGMGLAICKKFVESHGGSIEVESEEGKGTTFTVKLPVQHAQNGGEKT